MPRNRIHYSGLPGREDHFVDDDKGDRTVTVRYSRAPVSAGITSAPNVGDRLHGHNLPASDDLIRGADGGLYPSKEALVGAARRQHGFFAHQGVAPEPVATEPTQGYDNEGYTP